MNYLRATSLFSGSPERYPTLAQNWAYSQETLEHLRSRLAAELSDEIFTVAAAGSLGRMEACPLSDVDYIVLSYEEHDTTSDFEKLKRIVGELGFPQPKKEGVFSTAISLRKLIDSAGTMTEDLSLLARRILFLVESRPLFKDENFLLAVDAVFELYAAQVRREPNKHFVFLLNDLIRYFRSICVNYESTFWRENEKWPLRNLKLRHSRVLMYAGLLVLIGAASGQEPSHRVTYLRDHLHLTPLERLAAVYSEHRDDNFQRLASLYDVFLQQISDPPTREHLQNIDHAQRFEEPIFLRLKANAEAFIAELSRFLWARRGLGAIVSSSISCSDPKKENQPGARHAG